MIIKRKTIAQVEYHAPSKAIFLKENNEIVEVADNGEVTVLSSAPHRTVFNPGDDLSDAPDEVKKIAAALWQ